MNNYTSPHKLRVPRLSDLKPTIIVDSREQEPLPLSRLQAVRGTLTTGDYSVVGLEQLFSIERKSISVIFHNDAGEEAGRMNLFNCWPGGYKGPALNAKSSAHATEKIEISFETMEWK